MGVKTLMLSGDNQSTASAIAKAVGIDEARGGMLPEDKLAEIERLLKEHGDAVGMVGDGVNDAPALAKSTIGFAMGAAGTDTALETADVALMQDDLRGLPEFVALSRRTGAILTQNIALAIGIKVVFFALTLAGTGDDVDGRHRGCRGEPAGGRERATTVGEQAVQEHHAHAAERHRRARDDRARAAIP
jgi:Cd2+/Zn2+-exporting ATPase